MKHFRFTFTIITLLMMASVFTGCNPITNTPEPTGIVLKNNCMIAEGANIARAGENNVSYDANVIITGVDVYEKSRSTYGLYYPEGVAMDSVCIRSSVGENTVKLDNLNVGVGESISIDVPNGEYYYTVHFKLTGPSLGEEGEHFYTYDSEVVTVNSIVDVVWNLEIGELQVISVGESGFSRVQLDATGLDWLYSKDASLIFLHSITN